VQVCQAVQRLDMGEVQIVEQVAVDFRADHAPACRLASCRVNGVDIPVARHRSDKPASVRDEDAAESSQRHLGDDELV
jgi:hypothetical protein